MKQSLLIASAALGSSLAWEMDIRCPGYYTPPRMLQEGEEIFGNEDTDFYDANDMQQLDYIVLSPTTNNLRGAEEQSHRELQSSFQVKMNWEEGFCWQEEWIERQWCLSCQGKCGIGDPIWVQFCDVNDATQQFSYVPVAGSRLQVKIFAYSISHQKRSSSQHAKTRTDKFYLDSIPTAAPLNSLSMESQTCVSPTIGITQSPERLSTVLPVKTRESTTPTNGKPTAVDPNPILLLRTTSLP
jgi:hypothetical protein